MHLDKTVIQAGSHQEQTFPLFVKRRIKYFRPPSLLSVDLICVFDLSEYSGYNHNETMHFVRRFFAEVFPLMDHQDRLSVVLLDGLGPESPILEILPFTKLTGENKEKIISSFGQTLLRNKIQMRETPVKNILEKRDGVTQATGVFLFSDQVLSAEEIYKKRLGLQYVPTITRSVMKRGSENQTEMIKSFQYGLRALRKYVAGTIFFVKPEQSQLLKGVEIIDIYLGKKPDFTNVTWQRNSDGAFYVKSDWLDLDLSETFFFDIKIPKIPNDLMPESPMELKIASCQQIYTLLDGTQIIKNLDLTVKIFREGEEFLNEDKRREGFMQSFYYAWENVIYRSVKEGLALGDSGREMFERYKESVENSIVKDNSELQQSVRDLAEDLNYSYPEEENIFS